MTNIAPIGTGSVARAIGVGQKSEAPAAKAEPLRIQRGEDRVEMSDMAKYLSKLRQMPEVRDELVNRVRSELASGTYETPDKIDGAVDGLAEDLGI